MPNTLDRPPTLPPEVQSDPNAMSELAGGDGAPTAGDMQTQGVALQMAMAIEKMLQQLAQVLPGFESTAAQIVPALRDGIRQSVMGQAQGPTAEPGPFGAEPPGGPAAGGFSLF